MSYLYFFFKIEYDSGPSLSKIKCYNYEIILIWKSDSAW